MHPPLLNEVFSLPTAVQLKWRRYRFFPNPSPPSSPFRGKGEATRRTSRDIIHCSNVENHSVAKPKHDSMLDVRRWALDVRFRAANHRRTPCRNPFVTSLNCRYLPPLMPKPIARSKTRKAVSKRFKITATGKVKRHHASRRHLLSTKSGKRKRHMAKAVEVDKTDTYRIKSNLPFG